MSSFSSDISSEKPNSFSQTCTLLSRYLKENKGTLGDISLGMSFHSNGMPVVVATPTTETSDISTMDLFPTTVPENYGDTPKTRSLTSMDLFPQHSGFEPSVSEDEVAKIPNKVDHSMNKPMSESSQMTVFYGGQAFVYTDISAEKAIEITTFASKTTYHVPRIFVPAPIQRPRETTSIIGPNNMNNMHIEKLNSALAIDLPITRKASLTRFFEKRKDRISTRAPYLKNYSKALPPKTNQKSWLGLSSQSLPEHFE